MKNTIHIYNYNDELFDTGVPISRFKNIKNIHVDVIVGDEVVTIYYKNGKVEKFDASEMSGDLRNTNVVDFSYDISSKEDFEGWLEREESLEYGF